jgi:HEAT repeat protein
MLSPDVILTYLESNDPQDRITGLSLVGRHNQQDFVGDVLRLLTDRISAVREQAAKTLGMLQCAVSIEPLCEALSDPSYTVRFTAVWSLVSFGAAVIPHVQVVLQSEDKNARVAAFQVLSRLDDDEARAVIRRYWDNNRT